MTRDSRARPSPPDEVVATKAGVDGEKSTENGDFMCFFFNRENMEKWYLMGIHRNHEDFWNGIESTKATVLMGHIERGRVRRLRR